MNVKKCASIPILVALLGLPSQQARPQNGGTYEQRVNAGGTSYTDRVGKVWAEDQAFTEGSWGYEGGRTYSTRDPIANTIDDQLCQTERYQLMAYRFTVNHGTYKVTLHFAEIFYDNAGARQFDVTLEDSLVLDNLDIYAEAGPDAALVYTFEVEVDDRILDIEFGKEVDQPKISAIEVVTAKPDAAPPEITGVSAGNAGTSSATITWRTDEPATSEVEYGLDPGYGRRIAVDSVFVTQHVAHLSGLSSNTLYHFRVISADENGSEAASSDYTLETLIQGRALPNNPPSAVISVEGKTIVDGQVTVEPGETVQFVGSESSDPDGDTLYYRWTFGDGSVSEAADPQHTYAVGGTYDVTLVVDDDRWPQYDSNPFVIPLQQDTLTQRGGIIVADVNNDGLLDYLVSQKDDPMDSQTAPATIGAYAHDGTTLWVKDVNLLINEITYGFPGLYGPGLATADVDGDSELEVLHLTPDNTLIVRNGLTGDVEKTIALPQPEGGIGRWGQLQIANLRGLGDKDVILQADHDPNDFEDKNIAPWLGAVAVDTEEILWTTNAYYGLRHGGFRAADIDGDGLDEVAGTALIDDDGTRMNTWDYRDITGHLDAMALADIKPGMAGLEVVLLEESHQGDDRTALVNPDQVFFYASRNGDEPQNTAVGDFDPGRSGLEIWNRSRFNLDQRPWVLDADGNIIAEWVMNEKKPFGWSEKGVEMIAAIDWTGGDKNYIAAKERHTDGRIAVIDAMTGDFIRWWEEAAARLLVADVAGDYREELIVVNNKTGEIRVYWNDALNANENRRYWHQNQYKRQKENYNYYSP